MTDDIAWLRWALAAVLGTGAAMLLAASGGAHGAVGVAIAAAELAGAVLLVVRRTRAIGAAILLVVLAGACMIHALVGEAPPLAFAVYAVALIVVARRREVVP